MTDLGFHGDQDANGAALEVAVNTFPADPPDFLSAAMAAAPISHYPAANPARLELAERYDLDPGQLLPTAGGAEGFTLIARGLAITKALVVHPQFTEPEVALRAAGVPVHRLTLRPNFQIEASQVIDQARAAACDTVFVGNPTNPTSRLHPLSQLLEIVAAGLKLVVDEAFMDAVADPATSLLGRRGVVVLRSLTKLWSIPGVRAGWLNADEQVVAQLSQQQPPWSVSAAAAAAIEAICSTVGRTAEVQRRGAWRGYQRDLLARLTAVPGLAPDPDSRAPFLLIDTGVPAAADRLRRYGVTARRGETFPGLASNWLRVAARDPQTNAVVAEAIQRLREGEL